MAEHGLNVRLIREEEIELFGNFLPDGVLRDFISDQKMLLLGISAGAIACGAAAVIDRGLTAEIRSFYIAPAYRCLGYGEEAMIMIAEAFQQAGFYELTMSYEPESVRGADAIADALGFEKEPTGRAAFRFSVRDIAEKVSLDGVVTDHVQAFEKVSKRDRAILWEKLRTAGRDFIALPPDESRLYKDLCAVCFEDQEPCGAVFTEKLRDPLTGDPYYNIFYLANVGKKQSGAGELIAWLTVRGKDLLSPDEEIRFVSILPELTAYVEKVVGGPLSREVTARLTLNSLI